MTGLEVTSGERLVRLRKQLGLSQREMAYELGVTPGAIAMWELGKRPMPPAIEKIIEIYEEAIDEELALKNHEAVIRTICSGWARRLATLFGKGAQDKERNTIRSKLEKLLVDVSKATFSSDRIKRNVQIAFANRIVNAASQTKGLPMKVVQLMTYMRPDLDPQVRQALEEIYNLQYPLAPTVVAKIIAESLGAPPNKVFAEWSSRPFATASIGQVHLARLKSGERVAVKVQYPDIRASLNKDAGALEFVGELAGFLRPEFRSVIKDIRNVVLAETDYKRELENIEAFGELFVDEPNIIIPKVYGEYSSDNILTMEYIEGQSLKEFKNASYEERKLAAETIARFVTKSSFSSGLINTDAHAGNFIFCGRGRVGFIDFGRVVRVDFNGSMAQREFMKAAVNKDYAAAKAIEKHLPFIPENGNFPFDRFWDFFVKQNEHFHSWNFRFTHDYVAENLRSAREFFKTVDFKMTLETVWTLTVSAGTWSILSDLDVELDYGKITLSTLAQHKDQMNEPRAI